MTVCAYCRNAQAVNRDHVVPKSYRRKAPIPDDLAGTVPACFACNIRKGNRRLVPASWADKLAALEAAYPGTPWRIWNGDPKSSAYAEVHL